MSDKNKLGGKPEETLEKEELESEISDDETESYDESDESYDSDVEEDGEDDFDAVSVAVDGESKAERKARAKEEYRRREMERQQSVMARKAKEDARAAKSDSAGSDDKKQPDKKRAPAKEVKKDKPGFFKRIGKWFKNVFGELKHVTWPSFMTVVKSTTVVLMVTGIFLVVAMLMDSGLGWVYNWFTGKL